MLYHPFTIQAIIEKLESKIDFFQEGVFRCYGSEALKNSFFEQLDKYLIEHPEDFPLRAFPFDTIFQQYECNREFHWALANIITLSFSKMKFNDNSLWSEWAKETRECALEVSKNRFNFKNVKTKKLKTKLDKEHKTIFARLYNQFYSEFN